MSENLVKMAKLGNKEAFVELIENYRKKLYVIAKSRLNCLEDVKDAVQETLFQTYKCIDTIKHDECFNGWITRILINNCNNILREKQKFFCSYDNLECENYIVDEDVFIEIDSNLDFFSLIDFLNQEEKIIVVLYYSRGYTTNEMGEILDMNENTIRTKLRRIKQKIKERYRKDFMVDERNSRGNIKEEVRRSSCAG